MRRPTRWTTTGSRPARPRISPGEGRLAARTACGARPSDFVVLFTGQLVSRKRQDRRDPRRGAAGPDIHVIVAGSGELEADLKAEAARLGVRRSLVRFRLTERDERKLRGRRLSRAAERRGRIVGARRERSAGDRSPRGRRDHVGCGPDLVVSGRTGEIARAGSVEDLAAALDRVRAAGGRSRMGDACRQTAAAHAFGGDHRVAGSVRIKVFVVGRTFRVSSRAAVEWSSCRGWSG